MEFGTLILPRPERAIEDTRYAEERGFAQAWFPDSHMIGGDVYAYMVLVSTRFRGKLSSGFGRAWRWSSHPSATPCQPRVAASERNGALRYFKKVWRGTGSLLSLVVRT